MLEAKRQELLFSSFFSIEANFQLSPLFLLLCSNILKGDSYSGKV